MFRQIDARKVGRNAGIYLTGVGFAIVGALGIVGAIDLSPIFAWPALALGLALVVAVHEYLDGPI